VRWSGGISGGKERREGAEEDEEEEARENAMMKKKMMMIVTEKRGQKAHGADFFGPGRGLGDSSLVMLGAAPAKLAGY